MSAWLPVAAWMLVIFVLSGEEFSALETRGLVAWLLTALFPHLEPQSFELLHGLVRKAAHVTEYAVLGALTLRAFRLTRAHWPARRAMLAGVALASAWAVVDETHQAYQPSRTGSPFDVLLDSCGALVGAGLPLLWQGRKSRQRKHPARKPTLGRSR